MLRRGIRQFSSSRLNQDQATCQLLGKFGSTPTTFTTKSGKPAVRYLFAVNKGSSENQSTSWFNVTAFSEGAIEQLTREDLKGAKALVGGTLDVKRNKDENSGIYSDTVYINQTSLSVIERSKRAQDIPSEKVQAEALEDSFSV